MKLLRRAPDAPLKTLTCGEPPCPVPVTISARPSPSRSPPATWTPPEKSAGASRASRYSNRKRYRNEARRGERGFDCRDRRNLPNDHNANQFISMSIPVVGVGGGPAYGEGGRRHGQLRARGPQI